MTYKERRNAIIRDAVQIAYEWKGDRIMQAKDFVAYYESVIKALETGDVPESESVVESNSIVRFLVKMALFILFCLICGMLAGMMLRR